MLPSETPHMAPAHGGAPRRSPSRAPRTRRHRRIAGAHGAPALVTLVPAGPRCGPGAPGASRQTPPRVAIEGAQTP
ncbi:hypothetical protein GCM10010972_03230 [Cellulomonas carbonis]|nr:hypothetical protein GCM10010972_03230 [Cellulomonas carbonis]